MNQPWPTAVVVVLWTLVAAPPALVIVSTDGPLLVSVAVAILVAIVAVLTIYAVPALIGGKM